jgi:uncharacterized protein YegJ (DUF2314 family)
MPDVIGFERQDAYMNAAIAEASRTLPEFLEFVKAAPPGATFSLKARFVEGDQEEHIWLSSVEVVDETLEGTIANEPAALRDIAYGLRVQVERAQVSDWMVVANGKVHGAYTIRVMRDQMTPEERTEFDEEFGAAFE